MLIDLCPASGGRGPALLEVQVRGRQEERGARAVVVRGPERLQLREERLRAPQVGGVLAQSGLRARTVRLQRELGFANGSGTLETQKVLPPGFSELREERLARWACRSRSEGPVLEQASFNRNSALPQAPDYWRR